MSKPTDTAEEEGLLMELARLGMGVVRQVHGVVLATTEPTTLVALVNAYHHVSRGVRQSLVLRARFVAGTVVVDRAPPRAAAEPVEPRPETERPDWNDYERPDWHTPAPANEHVEALDDDPQVCALRIRRDLTVVSRTPALAAMPALRPAADHLAARAALLGATALRLADTS